MKYDLDKPFEVRILEDNDPDRPRFYIYTGLLDSDLFNADETILIIYLIASAYDNEINTINTTAISINKLSQKLGMSRVDVHKHIKSLEEKGVDLIAAEDTRHSRKLLNYFEISTPLTSYHEYNKYDKAKELIKRMRGGENIALVTDAGTPAISDPGEVLVKMCCEENIEVTSLPGATACITALTLSALSSKRFCFEGFLPREKKQRKEILNQIENEERTILFYEAPHHLKDTLHKITN